MFKNDDARGELNGFLDSGSHLVGDLRFDDTFRVDGRFEGRIHSSGRLVVGDSGEIEGEVHVAHIHVAGTIRGTVADAEKELAEVERSAPQPPKRGSLFE